MERTARQVTEAAMRRNLTHADAENDIIEVEQQFTSLLGRIETAPNMASVQEAARRARLEQGRRLRKRRRGE